jgi:hypothetical protein
LLSPGSFLRLGYRSELSLERSRTAEVRVRLASGEALIEVLDVATPLVIEQSGVTTVVLNPGLYEFNETRAAIAVYAGEVEFSKDDKQIIAETDFGVRTRSFREFRTGPDPASTLLAWSRTRSELLSSESAASAQAYSGSAGKWHGPAWYWDPWSASYTFLSASGFVNGPFGWPYYSPGYAPDSIPVHPRGDSWLYGPPVLSTPDHYAGRRYGPVQTPAPSVPLTAPGMPQFPNNRF